MKKITLLFTLLLTANTIIYSSMFTLLSGPKKATTNFTAVKKDDYTFFENDNFIIYSSLYNEVTFDKKSNEYTYSDPKKPDRRPAKETFTMLQEFYLKNSSQPINVPYESILGSRYTTTILQYTKSFLRYEDNNKIICRYPFKGITVEFDKNKSEYTDQSSTEGLGDYCVTEHSRINTLFIKGCESINLKTYKKARSPQREYHKIIFEALDHTFKYEDIVEKKIQNNDRTFVAISLFGNQEEIAQQERNLTTGIITYQAFKKSPAKGSLLDYLLDYLKEGKGSSSLGYSKIEDYIEKSCTETSNNQKAIFERLKKVKPFFLKTRHAMQCLLLGLKDLHKKSGKYIHFAPQVLSTIIAPLMDQQIGEGSHENKNGKPLLFMKSIMEKDRDKSSHNENKEVVYEFKNSTFDTDDRYNEGDDTQYVRKDNMIALHDSVDFFSPGF